MTTQARPGRRSALTVTLLALTLVAGLTSATSAASAQRADAQSEDTTGTWAGTISYDAQGAWAYTIGYRDGSDARRTMGSTTHDLHWQITLDGVKGNQSFDQFTDGGQATVDEFSWAGEAANVPSVTNPQCNYTAVGSMAPPATGSFSFWGLHDDGAPRFASAPYIDPALARSECSHGLVFGFSGPNAGTLWGGGGYDKYLWNNVPDSDVWPLFNLCTQPLDLETTPNPSTNAEGKVVVDTETNGACAGTRVESFGDSDVYHISDVTSSYTYDLTFTPDEDSCDVHSSYDAFRPYAKGAEATEAWLHFSVDTLWCKRPDGTIEVISVTPEAYTFPAQNLAESFLTQTAEAFLSYGDVWVGPVHSQSGNQVEARATIKTCLGIPVLGKIKYVNKLPEAFRGLAKLLKDVDGRWESVADKAAKLARAAAKSLEWAIEKGSKAAKALARAAVKAFGAAVYAMGEKVQLNVLLATVAVLADWSSSIPEAKWFLKTLAEDGATKIASKGSDLLMKFLETKVCWNIWRPKVRQFLGTPGAPGEFIDRSDDMPWRVERHTSAN